MKIAIMQPYFFPYIGYWQLINAVDIFVIYDDGKYMNNKWIHRNRIEVNNNILNFNVLLKNRSPYELINELELVKDDIFVRKQLASLKHAYHKAPYYQEVMHIISLVLENRETNLASYLTYQIQLISNYLHLNTRFVLSSSIDKTGLDNASQKVFKIGNLYNAFNYINAIGGMQYYDKNLFAQNGVNLSFLKTGDVTYNRLQRPFIPNLSIIDIMMFNSIDEIKILLDNYTLI